MPLLVSVLIFLVRFDLVNASSKMPEFSVVVLNWKLSALGFVKSLFYSAVSVALLMSYLATHEIPRYEKNAISHFFDHIGNFVARGFYFWGGAAVAWAVGSSFLEFIPRVDNVGWTAPMAVVDGLFVQLLLRKVKYYTVRGTPVLG
jgi:hypothetical protein